MFFYCIRKYKNNQWLLVMKHTIFFIWIVLSLSYLFWDLEYIFLALRLNLWFQLNCSAFILAACGAILQNILKNPIADPWILGVSGASTLSTVIVSLLHLTPILFWRTFGALSGAGIAIILLLIISKKQHSFNMSKFILIGLGINSFCSALIIFLQSLASPNEFVSSVIRISGHFSERTFEELILLFIALFSFTFYLNHRNNEISILSTGDELALSVGVPVTKIKAESLVISSIGLAISVSISGNIGFIGLVSPHIIRLLFGDSKVLSSELLFCVSGIIMMGAALLLRLLPNGVFVPVGTAIALLGAPFFIYILVKSSN